MENAKNPFELAKSFELAVPSIRRKIRWKTAFGSVDQIIDYNNTLFSIRASFNTNPTPSNLFKAAVNSKKVENLMKKYFMLFP